MHRFHPIVFGYLAPRRATPDGVEPALQRPNGRAKASQGADEGGAGGRAPDHALVALDASSADASRAADAAVSTTMRSRISIALRRPSSHR